MRVLPDDGHEVIGLDVLDSPHTDIVGSIVDRDVVQRAVAGVDAVVHTRDAAQAARRLARPARSSSTRTSPGR